MFVAFMLVHYFIWLSVRVEFQFEFEFNANTQTIKTMLQHECNNKI